MKELTEQGLVETAYVAADQTGAWLVWNVDSQAALEEAHSTLPLHPYTNSEITALAEEMYPRNYEHLDFAITEPQEMKMQPSLERALRHRDILKA